MQYRILGRTGMRVSDIGYGAWALGGEWGEQDDAESRKALHAALDTGVNFIDTAQKYGDGRSERIVGEVLKERSEDIIVASKVPLTDLSKWPPTDADDIMELYPPDFLVSQCEGTLRNLQRDYLDIYQFHTWTAAWNERDEWYDTMDKLKRDGKIRAWGISCSEPRPEDVVGAVTAGKIDTVQVIYNIFEQAPQGHVLPACAEHNVGVIVRVPFDEGSLTGKFTEKTQFGPGDFRKHYFRGNNLKATLRHVEHVKECKNWKNPDMPMAEYALRFCLSDQRVSTVIPGMRNVRQAELNTAVSDGVFLGADELENLKALNWKREFWSEEVAADA
jgi:aryl-alcohol dehydrogenase-like predicted oxidoreductase